MAYSFTEKSDYDSDSDSNFSAGAPGPVMVPMADILNHISKNNAHLEFGCKTLTMVAVQDIFEVFSWDKFKFSFKERVQFISCLLFFARKRWVQ